jgi:DNA sulfur modification protein DndE
MTATASHAPSLVEIATAGFRATTETDDAARRIKDAIGAGANYVPARLAIGRSLALPDRPAPAEGEPGRTIKGENLFGTGADLATWVSLIIEYAGEAPPDLRAFQALVSAHWARGMRLLADLYDASDGDAFEFKRSLAEAALPEGPARPVDGAGPAPAAEGVPVALVIPLGEVAQDAATGEPVAWALNAPGGSPHAAFMGGVGSGKTRTAASMLRAIRDRTPVPLIAFDFKGDMSDEKNRLHQAFGATVLSPPDTPIPLDVFALADRSRNEIVKAAQRLRDSLANLKETRFGDNQKRRLGDALEQALGTRTPCRLGDVRDILRQSYARDSVKEDGAVNALVDLCRLPLFEPALSPAEFFSRSWIITLRADVPDLFRVSTVALLTDALERYINAQPDAPTDGSGNRALRTLCVIDEAHRILGARLPGLANLIRLSRSKGGVVVLISQRPDDFEGEDDDFLAEMGLLVCFATNAKEAATRRILGPGASLAMLGQGEAWAKLRGESAARRILAWR